MSEADIDFSLSMPSSSNTGTQQRQQIQTLGVIRFSIGSRVISKDCSMILEAEKKCGIWIHLNFSLERKDGEQKRRLRQKYFVHKRQYKHIRFYFEDEQHYTLEMNSFSFVVFKVSFQQVKDQGFGKYCSTADMKDGDPSLVVALRDEEDFRNQCMTLDEANPISDTRKILEKNKNSIYVTEIDNIANNNNHNNIVDHRSYREVLVYPFNAPFRNEDLVKAISHLPHQIRCVPLDNGAPKQKILPITYGNIVASEDVDTLDVKGRTGGYLNDAIINFGIKWFIQDGDQNIHIFNSQRVTQFLEPPVKNDLESIADRNKHRGLNIFDKDILLLPVNHKDHWTLLAIVLPGRLLDGEKSFPFVLVFDPLRCRKNEKGRVKQFHQSILDWLIAERNKNGRTGSGITCPTIEQVKMSMTTYPIQQDTFSCGLYVIKYVWALFEVWRDIKKENKYNSGKDITQQEMSNEIKSSTFFNFDNSCIEELRQELPTLIDILQKFSVQ